jgi:uridine monophosphate synthetase
MSFLNQLENRAKQTESLLGISLHPNLDRLDDPSAAGLLEFCQEIISQTADLTLAYLLDPAALTMFAAKSPDILEQIIALVPEDIPLILDTRTSLAQASSLRNGSQAVTVNPYSGQDSLQSLAENPDAGIFVLCKTASQGTSVLQEKPLRTGKLVYERVATLARRWNRAGNVGILMDTTQPTALRRVRKAAPTSWMLMRAENLELSNLPGALQAGLRPDGLGMMITFGEQILHAGKPRFAAQEIQGKINYFREAWNASPLPIDTYDHIALARALFENGCIKFGDFTIEDEVKSPVFIDLLILPSLPELLYQVAASYSLILESLTFDHIAPIPYTGLPIGTAVSLQGNWPAIYPRKDPIPPEEEPRVEGIFHPGERTVVIDDLTATGISKFEIIETLANEQLVVEDIVVLIDRESGANQKLVQAGYRFHAVFTLSQLCAILRQEGLISQEQEQAVLAFIQSTNQN